jgi:chloramphenicol-sensitive protein RarD
MQFLVGWAVFHEPLARDRLVAFVFIWIGLAIYGVDMVRAARGPKRPDSNAV